MSTVPYTCPRCNYSTSRKDNMKKHLHLKNKPCPSTHHDIELTDDIKHHILDNRIYRIQDPVKITTQTLNNINMMNNFVANMDPLEKIKKITEYCQVEITDFEEKIESFYAKDIKRLENDTFKYGFELEENDFMMIVDKLTKVIRGDQRNEFIEEINVIYDTKSKRIKVYSGQWDVYLVNHGLKHLIHTIIEYYLEKYEIYLIRKLAKPVSILQNSSFMKCIRDYYRFIGCFEIQPFCNGKTDSQLLYSDDEENQNSEDRVARRFQALYETEYNGLTNAQRKAVHHNVLEIIKSNSKCNIAQLDKDIIGIVNIDPEFNKHLLIV